MTPRARALIFYLLPPLIWMGAIFLGSSIPSTGLPQMPEFWRFLAHRFTHMLEYSVLGILWLRAYNHWRQPHPRDLMPVLIVGAGILILALLDEWHQSFVPGRTPQLLDAVFDLICAGIGMVAYRL